MVLRTNVEFAKQIFHDRLGDDYVYGGTWDPNDTSVGCDCSGLVTDVLSAVFDGPAMPWDREGLSTEGYRYKPYGVQQVGPFTLTHVASPDQIPPDAAVRIDLHHEGQGGPDSHMHCVVDGVVMESNGDHGCCTIPGGAIDPGSPYWNDWWFVPGPIQEDVPAPPNTQQSTFWADVSEFQVPVDYSYPYQVLSIRSNDGTYQDRHFAQNYQWCVAAADRLSAFIVYCYWRPNWQDTAQTLINMVNAQGGPHPKMIVMIDVESGGNPSGDQSSWINGTYMMLAEWLGNPKRVIGYGNTGDLDSLWPNKPNGELLVVAGYGSDPNYPNKIAHQYTDGQVGANQGMPMGCAPFGNCDMNVADGLSPDEFAAACGIGGDDFLMALTAQQQQEVYDKIMAYPGVLGGKWSSRSMFADDQNGVDDTVGMVLNTDANAWNAIVIIGAIIGVTEHVNRVKRLAAGQGPGGSNPTYVEYAKKLLAYINKGA